MTIDRLVQLLRYEPSSGEFFWIAKSSPASRIQIGSKAGYVSHGYTRIRIDGRLYMAHRLAWLVQHGSWPNNEIDHINGVKTDNRIENLRDVTASINSQNQRKAKSNNKSSGLLGVHYGKRQRKFGAHIRVNGRLMHLGYFDTPDAAHSAYIEAKRNQHEGCSI